MHGNTLMLLFFENSSSDIFFFFVADNHWSFQIYGLIFPVSTVMVFLTFNLI